MLKTRMAAGAALTLAAWLAASPALAQDVGEIVVTAQRRTGGGEGGPAPLPQPHVVVFRRADNLLVETQVDCDTRDQKDRLGEMKSTLRSMIAAAAAGGQIELGVESGAVILPLKPEALDTMLSPGDRDDTTTTTIVVKTHVGATDTFEAASARIDAFILGAKVVGRTQVVRHGDWQLTLITPRQYRPQIVAAIAQDADDTRKAFGAGYAVEIEGLEHPVAWNRSGPLDLALFIPYALKIEPLPGR
jgi:hypothetical protein